MMTGGHASDLQPGVKPGSITLTQQDRGEVAAWISAHSPEFPEPVQRFLSFHLPYLTSSDGLKGKLDEAHRELLRALGAMPSTERRRSGAPLSALPPAGTPLTEREKVEQAHQRSTVLRAWHRKLVRRHDKKAKTLHKRLSTMPKDPIPIPEDIPVEDIELTPEEEAEAEREGQLFLQRLLEGNGADPAFMSVRETLMPGGAVLANEQHVQLPVTVPQDLADATPVKTLTEERTRYDFSVAVTRVNLEVEKKVVLTADGERHVISASTAGYGPKGWAVPWEAMATLAIMVGQFSLPFNRLGTMFSTVGKRFTAASLGRMFHDVAMRVVPIYLYLARQLAGSAVLAGDDTSSRVLEVSGYFAGDGPKDKVPWADYQTRAAAKQSVQRCREEREARIRRREDGDRTARPTAQETPTLGMLIGSMLAFESPLRSGEGPKTSLNTTVVSGRVNKDDPHSLIVLYRSHLGSHGNLLESLLEFRNPEAGHLVVQGDLSRTNLVASPELRKRFSIKAIGCSAHARRPFAQYEHEDPVLCAYMLHLFLGLAIHEQRLDVHGRNRKNVLAVRGSDSRETWDQILELAKEMEQKWPPATKLGTGARYIINHFDKLTAYLEDPHLEPTNNLRERMLRMEKLLESSSMFRKTLEGRFALDVVRTILQTAVAAGAPAFDYLVHVLRAPRSDVAANPARFTPHAWARNHT